jgi:sterol desaturase/sphingolipid hydroxylase (fatty acid hydroxylase superfamily)
MTSPEAHTEQSHTANQPAAGAALLVSLAVLFLVRVMAQLVQWATPSVLLPPFEAWQGSGLPYPVLLAAQVTILAAMLWAIRRRHAGLRVFAPRLAGPALWFAVAYFLAMLARLAAGFTLLSDVAWFAGTLPAYFHLVLASFLLAALAGDRRVAGPAGATSGGRALARAVSWPGGMALAVSVHLLLAGAGLAIGVSAVLAIALGAGLVITHEILWPYRRDWRPSAGDVRTDLVYLAVVQMLLPRLLGLAAIWAIAALPAGAPSVAPLWPHHWSPLAQAALMVLSADLLRYWLHRAAHTYTPLWRLHAVHHAPKRLYSINVGRFHPVEEALQYLFDALPFLLLGVSEQVLALYFVFYAVNGFFQHSNCDIALGPLNWLISGPELHRWHHSIEAAESNRNYGNNLIVWDLLFGTFFLPRDRAVGRLGLINRDYPRGFLGQLRGPFIAGLDKRCEG